MLSCPLAGASKQVSDKFTGVCDNLTTFSARKTCLGHVVIVLAGSRQVCCVLTC